MISEQDVAAHLKQGWEQETKLGKPGVAYETCNKIPKIRCENFKHCTASATDCHFSEYELRKIISLVESLAVDELVTSKSELAKVDAGGILNDIGNSRFYGFNGVIRLKLMDYASENTHIENLALLYYVAIAYKQIPAHGFKYQDIHSILKKKEPLQVKAAELRVMAANLGSRNYMKIAAATGLLFGGAALAFWLAKNRGVANTDGMFDNIVKKFTQTVITEPKKPEGVVENINLLAQQLGTATKDKISETAQTFVKQNVEPVKQGIKGAAATAVIGTAVAGYGAVKYARKKKKEISELNENHQNALDKQEKLQNDLYSANIKLLNERKTNDMNEELFRKVLEKEAQRVSKEERFRESEKKYRDRKYKEAEALPSQEANAGQIQIPDEEQKSQTANQLVLFDKPQETLKLKNAHPSQISQFKLNLPSLNNNPSLRWVGNILNASDKILNFPRASDLKKILPRDPQQLLIVTLQKSIDVLNRFFKQKNVQNLALGVQNNEEDTPVQIGENQIILRETGNRPQEKKKTSHNNNNNLALEDVQQRSVPRTTNKKNLKNTLKQVGIIAGIALGLTGAIKSGVNAISDSNSKNLSAYHYRHYYPLSTAPNQEKLTGTIERNDDDGDYVYTTGGDFSLDDPTSLQRTQSFPRLQHGTVLTDETLYRKQPILFPWQESPTLEMNDTLEENVETFEAEKTPEPEETPTLVENEFKVYKSENITLNQKRLYEDWQGLRYDFPDDKLNRDNISDYTKWVSDVRAGNIKGGYPIPQY
jgi:hypothetical protein